ncbi:MAG: pseudouridine synthase [Verrucomicrobiota bacterium]
MPAKSSSKNAIGFPPTLLGDAPFRLLILGDSEPWLALDKPAGVGMRAFPWDEKPDIDAALNLQLQEAKPELMRTGASLFGSVYYLDPEISGVAVFAKNRDSLAELRNRFGSGECRFKFLFIAGRHDDLEVEFRADAPLLPHRVKPKMIPSTAKGKKSFTDFRKLDESKLGWALWEARTDFFRPHQVRAHAATHGIPVLGDTVYGGPVAPTVRQLQPRARRSDLDKSVYQGLAIHLSRAELFAGEPDSAIESHLPKQLSLLLKRLGLTSEA